ncbi:transposase, partial [Aeromonas caviae]|uniref:transposase n=1 Tax=Aeromonas caviae TaxID=648 RepID=UPI002B46F85E
YMKASIRAKVEHPFRIIKRQFGFVKTRYKGLLKNDNQLAMLFTLANLLHIPVENEHLFRFKMNADSGLRVHR